MSLAQCLLNELSMKVSDNYSNPEGVRYSCHLLALEIAKVLLKEGKNPNILEYRDMIEGSTERRRLVPIPYNGEVDFDVHAVACAEGKAYDPILGFPVPAGQYDLIMFGRKVTSVKVWNSAEELKY
jgi:hypothetical protein